MSSAQTCRRDIAVEQVFERILTSRRISRADQQLLMSALLAKDSLDREEESLIDEIFDGLKRGLLRVVDRSEVNEKPTASVRQTL
jgi:hypothetical protein